MVCICGTKPIDRRHKCACPILLQETTPPGQRTVGSDATITQDMRHRSQRNQSTILMLVSRLREVEAIIREELLLLTPVNRVREHNDRNILRELFQCLLIVFQSLNRMLILQVHICPLESTLVRKIRITTTNMKHDRTLIKSFSIISLHGSRMPFLNSKSWRISFSMSCQYFIV